MFKEALEFSDKIKRFSGIQSVILLHYKAKDEPGTKGYKSKKSGTGESDIDSNFNLLVVYRKKDEKIIKKIESLVPENLNLINININELKDEPHILNALSDGIVLHGHPLVLKAEDVYLKARMIISYDTSKLHQGERSRLNRALYGGISTYQKDGERIRKEYPGLVERIGAQKIGKAVIIVNRLNAFQISQVLERFGADWEKIPIWSY